MSEPGMVMVMEHGGPVAVPIPVLEGRKDDQGKPAADLLPADALLEVAAVLEYGRKKYQARNWERGMAWGRMGGALLRHTFRWMNGEEIDPESNLHHLAHAACCSLMLLSMVKRQIGTDDRKALP